MDNALINDNTMGELSKFLYHTLFSPYPSTLHKSIQAGYLTTWPGLTESLIKNHLPKSTATAKGRLDQTRRNIQSTQSQPPGTISLDPKSAITSITHRINEVMVSIFNPNGQNYTNLTGRFTVRSN